MGGTITKDIHIYNDFASNIVVDRDGDKQKIEIINFQTFDTNQPNFWENLIKNKKTQIDYCILDNFDNNLNNGLENCIKMFSGDDKLNMFSVNSDGDNCDSFWFSPGVIIKDLDNAKKVMGDLFDSFYKSGKKCTITYRDYTYIDSDMTRCCFNTDTNKCNSNLINNFTTNHCNPIMLKLCNGNENNINCINWLEQSLVRIDDDEALNFYKNYCKINFDNQICDYFCKISRYIENDKREAFCDSALKYWCNNNKDNPNCQCLYTPTNKIDTLSNYLGPKECWIENCANQKNSKWLTKDQLIIRSNCKLTSCIVTIENINLNNSVFNIVNNCIKGATINSKNEAIIKILKKKINNTTSLNIGIFFSPETLFLFLSLLLINII